MKRILTALCALLILSACDDARATIKDSKPYFKVGKETVTNREIYEALLENYGVEAISLFVNEYIYNQIATPGYDPMVNVNKMLAEYREEYGDDYFSEIFGYEKESDLIELYVAEEKTNLIFSTYIKDNYAAIIENYLPTKLAIAQFDDAESALKALEAVKNGETVAAVAEEFGITDLFDGEPLIFSKDSALPYEVESYGLYATGPDLVDNPISASDDAYYIVQVISVDREAIKDEIVEEMTYAESINTEAITYYCKQFKITYYDKTMLDLVTASSPEYLP